MLPNKPEHAAVLPEVAPYNHLPHQPAMDQQQKRLFAQVLIPSVALPMVFGKVGHAPIVLNHNMMLLQKLVLERKTVLM